MATVNFTQGKFESFLDSGAVNNGGDVAFFVADGTYSTAKTTYTTYALSTPNAHPEVLDSAGRAEIYFAGDADIRVRDSAGVTVYTQRNVNPAVVVVSYLYSTNTTLDGTHAESMIEVTGTTTISLTAASTLGQGWRVNIKNTGAGVVSIARLAGGDKINGTASDITLPVGDSIFIAVSDAIDGFVTYGARLAGSHTWTGDNIHSGLESFAKTKFSVPLGPNYLNNISIDATVAANALTMHILGNDGAVPSATNPAQASFRNSALTTGTTTVATATAATTVVAPDGATLGFIASEESYLYGYALNNSGTVEAAVCGLALDTNILHSTTAISATADSRSVLYSTTARTNVAIRFIGLIKIVTGATPGQWGTAATIKATATEAPPSLSLGYSQTWQDVTGSRVLGTSYKNSTGRPIEVRTTVTIGTSTSMDTAMEMSADNSTWVQAYRVFDYNLSVSMFHTLGGVVPNGWYYRTRNVSSTATLSAWSELR